MTEIITPDDDWMNATPIESSDGKVECPDCGGRYTLTKSGNIRSHNCGGVRTVSRTPSKTKRTKKSKNVPTNVYKLGSPAIASGVEFGARRVVASIVPCDPSIVPADIPDDDVHVMIDPLINLVWPAIPAKAQSIITSIVDQEDLILCVLAWAEYGSNLNKWAQNERQARLLRERQQANGVSPARHESSDGNRLPIGIEPFQPLAPS